MSKRKTPFQQAYALLEEACEALYWDDVFDEKPEPGSLCDRIERWLHKNAKVDQPELFAE